MRVRGVIILLSVLFIVPVPAQRSVGKLAGVVKTSSGEPLVGVNIILAGYSLGAATNTDGYYVISNIPPGNYKITVSYIGYKKVTRNISVLAHTTTKQDFSLEKESLSNEIVVITDTKWYRIRDVVFHIILLAAALAYFCSFTGKSTRLLTLAHYLFALSFGAYGVMNILDYGFGVGLSTFEPGQLVYELNVKLFTALGVLFGLLLIGISVSLTLQKKTKQVTLLLSIFLAGFILADLIQNLLVRPSYMGIIITTLHNLILLGSTLIFAGIYTKHDHPNF